VLSGGGEVNMGVFLLPGKFTKWQVESLLKIGIGRRNRHHIYGFLQRGGNPREWTWTACDVNVNRTIRGPGPTTKAKAKKACLDKMLYLGSVMEGDVAVVPDSAGELEDADRLELPAPDGTALGGSADAELLPARKEA
jgi:hypothetical protein